MSEPGCWPLPCWSTRSTTRSWSAGARCSNQHSVLGDDRARPAEPIVDPGLDDLHGLPDLLIERSGAEDRSALEGDLLVAEVHIVVLGHHRPVVPERALEAYADHPSQAG